MRATWLVTTPPALPAIWWNWPRRGRNARADLPGTVDWPVLLPSLGPSHWLECPSMKSAKVQGHTIACLLLLLLGLPGTASAQRDKDDEPTAILNFIILKEDNGKPVRNAAVIMHPVNNHGKQGRGGLELKTDANGKTSFDGIPYGKLRVQVLASGFQTFGEDYEVNQGKMEFTVRLKRPQGQYSIYDDHSAEKKDEKKDDKKDDKTPPPPPANTKPQ